jgi:hypothetical protein
MILMSPEGMWALRNLVLKASQVITWPSGCMARTFSHHAPAAPTRKWVAYSTLSFAPTPAYSNLFLMVRSQSSASGGSMDLE